MLTAWLLLGVSILLVIAAGVFVAAEFSFVTVDRTKVAQAAAEGDASAAGVLQALRSLSTQLSGRPGRHHRSPTSPSASSPSRRSRG